MKLRVTLRQPEGSVRNILITADATATAGDVAYAIATAPDHQHPLANATDVTMRVYQDGRPQQGWTIPPSTPLIDSGLSSGATIELSLPDDYSGALAGQAVAVVRVISGPDAGLEAPLPEGSSLIGRVGDARLVLTDNRISKEHARIYVGDKVEIIDNHSANGIHVGGRQVQRAVLGPGDIARLGETEITVTRLIPASSLPSSSTDIAFVRSPVVVERPIEEKIQLPQPPTDQKPRPFPVLMLMAPVLMGAAMFAFMRNPMTLMMVALSPLLMIGNYVSDRGTRKRDRREQIENFRAEIAQLEQDFQKSHADERRMLLAMYPPTDVCLQTALDRGPVMWSRRPEHPEFLQLRLGLGSMPSHLSIDKPQKTGIPEYVEMAETLRSAFSTIHGVPVVGDLRIVGGVGVCGQRAVLDGVAHALVTQLACLHSPAEVVMCCMTSATNKERWSWLEWLPHTASPHSPLHVHLSSDSASGKVLLDGIEALIAMRGGGSERPEERRPLEEKHPKPPASPIPAVILICDDPLVDRARLTRVAEAGPDVGVHVVWVTTHRADIPAACRTFLDVGDGQHASAGLVRHGLTIGPVSCESIDATTAMSLARRLAPLYDAGVPTSDDTDVPSAVPVVTLIGQDAADDPSLVLGRWKENESYIVRDGQNHPRSRTSDLRALVGHTGTEPMTLDLRTQGPHALVGGTTGAGKSEFLQAWVLGMAHAYSPDRVTFLFVDYKGGAAFAKCIELPHCVGLVTDLSPYLVQRALRSLRAELRYREHLLNAKGAKDLLELESRGDPDCPPSLIIIVDEFAALVSEVPEFVDGVVDVAQRGRSLGLHLILATQRPAGVIKDNLRANTNLRVALRMADETDSEDVLGDKMAAHFSPSTPGRGAAKTGPGRIQQFQSAFPGARTPAQPPKPPISIVELDFGHDQAWRMQALPKRADVDKDINRIVETVAKAADLGRIPAPRKPWLEALADSYNLEKMQQRTDTELVLGVIDDPDNQAQHAEYFRPDADGHIVFYGAGGSGKSTALRTLAIAAAITPRGGPVHVYGIDCAGGALVSLEDLPHVGSIVNGDDTDSTARLIGKLVGIIEERAERYSAVRASNIVEYRAISGRSDEPRILLLVDGIGTFRATYETTLDLQRVYNGLNKILVEGRSVGVHVVACADRPNAISISMASSFQRKVVLRQSSEDTYLQLNVPKNILTPASPPGRCLQPEKPQELQLCILGQNPNVAAQAKLAEMMGREIAPFLLSRPEPIRNLPVVAPASDMPTSLAGKPVLGIEDTTLEPISFEPSGLIMVAGLAQTGRTNAVHWLAESIHRAYPSTPVVHLTARRSPISNAELWTRSVTGADAITGQLPTLIEIAEQAPPDDQPLLAIFIEALPDFIGTPMESQLADLLKICKRNGHLVVAEGETTSWSSPWPLVMEVRNARTGLILQPDQSDGDSLLRTSLPRVKRADFPVGRGFWIKAGKAVKVQIPLVED